MIIIGERINSTRSRINEAIKNRDAAHIIKEATAQLGAGANYIDVNCAMTAGEETADIDWVVSVIKSSIKEADFCLDSPDHLAIERGLESLKTKGNVFINSITGEDSRINNIVPLAVKYDAKLIALTMTESGMPNTAIDRLTIAKEITAKVKNKGFDIENLYFDPLIRPISTEPDQAKEVLRAIPMIKSLGVKTVCGLSNVSYGLPDRRLINAIFLAMAIQNGLDAAILDPTDKHIASGIAASRALLCDDEYCGEYIKAFREGRLI